MKGLMLAALAVLAATLFTCGLALVVGCVADPPVCAPQTPCPYGTLPPWTETVNPDGTPRVGVHGDAGAETWP